MLEGLEEVHKRITARVDIPDRLMIQLDVRRIDEWKQRKSYAEKDSESGGYCLRMREWL